MPTPKTKKDPTEEQDPKKQPPATPSVDDSDPPADPGEPQDSPVADPDPEKAPTNPEDPPTDPETPPAEPDPPATDPVTDPVTDPQPEPENAALLKLQLMEAKAQVAAYKNGVKPAAVEDVVVLAMHAVKTSGGELTEEALHQAITSVLERHPEWNSTTTPAAPVKAGAEPPAEPPKNQTTAALHGKVVL